MTSIVNHNLLRVTLRMTLHRRVGSRSAIPPSTPLKSQKRSRPGPDSPPTRRWRVRLGSTPATRWRGAEKKNVHRRWGSSSAFRRTLPPLFLPLSDPPMSGLSGFIFGRVAPSSSIKNCEKIDSTSTKFLSRLVRKIPTDFHQIFISTCAKNSADFPTIFNPDNQYFFTFFRVNLQTIVK